MSSKQEDRFHCWSVPIIRSYVTGFTKTVPNCTTNEILLLDIIATLKQSLKLQSDSGRFPTIFGSCLTKHQFVWTKSVQKTVYRNFYQCQIVMSEHFGACSDILSGNFENLILGTAQVLSKHSNNIASYR